MNLAIFGTGYVGLDTEAFSADVGRHVVCVDVDAVKINRLNAGERPLRGPGLEAVVSRNVAAGSLEATTDIGASFDHAPVQFIAVGTPPDESGTADLRYVCEVARAHHLLWSPPLSSRAPGAGSLRLYFGWASPSSPFVNV